MQLSIVDTHIQEIYRYRGLIYSLVARELQARYRGSVLGFFWSFLSPLLLFAVYALVFSVYMRIQMENYTSYLFVGLLPWTWFSASLMEGATSIIGSGNLVTKVPFPAQVLPLVKVLANLFNYLLSMPILIVVLFIGGIKIGWPWLAFPLVLGSNLLLTLGISLFLACINTYFRDTQHLLGIILTLWFFLTPILYPASMIPDNLKFLLWINPEAIYIREYQDIFFYMKFPDWQGFLYVTLFSILILLLGIWIFEAFKEGFAEKI